MPNAPTIILADAPIETFANGLKLFATTAPGKISRATGREGFENVHSFGAYSPILVDAGGAVVGGPIDINEMAAFARRVIEGNCPADDDPGVALSLAAALFFVIDALAFKNRA